MASATNFPADVVPQAPEDPLFGLMRAFRADESKDKVDLVSFGVLNIRQAKKSGEMLENPADMVRFACRALAHTEMTTRSLGCFLSSRRYVTSVHDAHSTLSGSPGLRCSVEFTFTRLSASEAIVGVRDTAVPTAEFQSQENTPAQPGMWRIITPPFKLRSAALEIHAA